VLILPQALTQTQATQSLAGLAAEMANEGEQVVVDVAPLAQFDSVALAVLLALHRQAQALGKSLQLQGTPPRLADLARLYGVSDLLGLAPAVAPAGPR